MRLADIATGSRIRGPSGAVYCVVDVGKKVKVRTDYPTLNALSHQWSMQYFVELDAVALARFSRVEEGVTA